MANLWQEMAAGAETGGIWDRVDDQLASPTSAADGAAGLWGRIVVAQADGLWSEANKETMLLERPQLQRESLWNQANDETLILPREGLLPIWEAVLAQADETGSWDLAGTIFMHRPEVSEDMWSRAREETVIISRPDAGGVFRAELAGRDLTTWRPRRRPGWALKELIDHSGKTYWILKNLRDNTYVRLSEEQVFIWNELDGEATVQDIAVAYMITYGRLAINSLILLLDRLQQKGFIEDPLLNVYGAVDESVARRRANVWWRRALRFLLNHEFAIRGIDGLIAQTYQRGGRLLFTRPVQAVLLLIALAGAAAFFLHMRSGAYSVFTGSGSLIVIGIITLYVLQFITLLIHEWAHAVTTKHYRREVRKGGFLLYFGMPAAFVDTTDIWMSPRRERILVSWAGPYSGFVLGGLASLLILLLPGAFMDGVLYQFAFLTYLTSFMNLNPLLKLDGYYILMDWLEIPRLREKSLAFVAAGLWPHLRSREPFSREERIFAVFGLLAGAWTIFALLLAAQLWGGALLGFLRRVGETPSGAAALAVIGLALLALLSYRYLWLPLRRARRRR